MDYVTEALKQIYSDVEKMSDNELEELIREADSEYYKINNKDKK